MVPELSENTIPVRTLAGKSGEWNITDNETCCYGQTRLLQGRLCVSRSVSPAHPPGKENLHEEPSEIKQRRLSGQTV